jgi:hypothetical protein
VRACVRACVHAAGLAFEPGLLAEVIARFDPEELGEIDYVRFAEMMSGSVREIRHHRHHCRHHCHPLRTAHPFHPSVPGRAQGLGASDDNTLRPSPGTGHTCTVAAVGQD